MACQGISTSITPSALGNKLAAPRPRKASEVLLCCGARCYAVLCPAVHCVLGSSQTLAAILLAMLNLPFQSSLTSPHFLPQGAVLLSPSLQPQAATQFEAVLVLLGGHWPARGLLSGEGQQRHSVQGSAK